MHIAIFSLIPPICLKYEKCVHQKHLGRKGNYFYWAQKLLWNDSPLGSGHAQPKSDRSTASLKDHKEWRSEKEEAGMLQ